MKNEEFDEMCNRAGIKKEMLCDTVFTRQFKEKKQYKKIPINPECFNRILKKIGRKKLDDIETYSDIQGKNER